MKRVVWGFAPLVFALLTGAAWGAPEIVVEQDSFNFGQVYQGEKVEHTFRFQNVGDAPLHIDKVRTSCGCTAALPSATEIAPGESGELSTTFDSGRFRGQVTKTIYLYSNDPLRQVTQLYIRGTVNQEIVQEPARVELGTLTPGEEKEVRVTLTNRGEQEIAFPSVQATVPELQAELSAATLAPDETLQVILKAVPVEGKTRLSGYVIVKTSSARVPELRIPVYGTVEAPAPGR